VAEGAPGRPCAFTLGGIQTDTRGDQWLDLVGKGDKAGKVALPPRARGALDRYLIRRRLPVTPARWNPQTPLIGSLEQRKAWQALPDSTSSQRRHCLDRSQT